MKICSFFVLLFVFANFLHSQTIPNFNKIKKFAKSQEYSVLLYKYVNNDNSLTFDDYVFLYYGQVYQDNYQPYFKHQKEDELFFYLSKPPDSIDYNLLLKYNEEILFKNKMILKYLNLNGILYEAIYEDSIAKIWYDKYEKIIDVVLKSGDGRSLKTAYVVACISDEYTVLQHLGLRFKNQQLLNEKKVKFYNIVEALDENNKIVKIYFDISLIFEKK